MNYIDSDEIEKHNAEQENISIYNSVVLPYRKELKTFKCATHHKVVKIDMAYKWPEYSDGNYTRIYFSKPCCTLVTTQAQEKLKAKFPKYSAHRVFNHDEV